MHPLPLKSIKEANSANRESDRGQSCGRKRKFKSHEDALQCSPKQHPYLCDYCCDWHLSSKGPDINKLEARIKQLEI